MLIHHHQVLLNAIDTIDPIIILLGLGHKIAKP